MSGRGRKNKIVAIIGESASGKTEIQNMLVERGYFKAVSHTTRIPRDGEVDGGDYHFINNQEFFELDKQGQFLEKTMYHVNNEEWWYGFTKDCVIKDCTVLVVINPHGLKQFLEHEEIRDRIAIVHIVSSLGDRIRRYTNRESIDSNTKIDCNVAVRLVQRLLADDEDFKDENIQFAKELDSYYIVENNGMDKDKLEEVVNRIIEIIEK